MSIFMLDKKLWDKKKSENISNPSSTMREDAFTVLKKDPQNLARLRHPAILNLIEAPQEDEKFMVYITEPVEFSLACLSDKSKDHLREKVPQVLEIKLIMLELLEAINFMHQNARVVHAGLAPECLFITRDGKIKISGLNFCSQLSQENTTTPNFGPMICFNEYTMYPNLKFAAPEVS